MQASLFTQTQASQLQRAVDLMVQGNAPELPFDSTCMESVAKAAASLGFVTSDGAFVQLAKDRPISTLISLLLSVGGAPGGVVPAVT